MNMYQLKRTGGKGDHMISNPTPTLERFIRQKHIQLTTYRRNGRAVPTTVHIVVEGGHAFIRTWNTAGKFKRIRHNPAVEIAPSNKHGQATGSAIHARARVLSGAEAAHAGRLLARKYPLMQGILVPLAHRLYRVQTMHIELTLVDL
jgi:PPOX class probable F420-dependent enzyme